MNDPIEHFKDRAARAHARLIADSGPERLYVGIVGLPLQDKTLRLTSDTCIRAVEEPPSEIELARALFRPETLSTVARYAHQISHELCVPVEGIPQQQGVTRAWHLLSALRVRTNADFLVPLSANYSWSAINAAAERTCAISLFEDVPRARVFGTPRLITQADADWVVANEVAFVSLINNPTFRLAVDSITTHSQEASMRMSIASLWAGLEALAGVNQEITFRLSAMIASFLEGRGQRRLELVRELRKLYAFRSKAVHGAELDEEKMDAHIARVRTLLSRVLIKLTERTGLVEPDEWDALLFT